MSVICIPVRAVDLQWRRAFGATAQPGGDSVWTPQINSETTATKEPALTAIGAPHSTMKSWKSWHNIHLNVFSHLRGKRYVTSKDQPMDAVRPTIWSSSSRSQGAQTHNLGGPWPRLAPQFQRRPLKVKKARNCWPPPSGPQPPNSHPWGHRIVSCDQPSDQQIR